MRLHVRVSKRARQQEAGAGRDTAREAANAAAGGSAAPVAVNVGDSATATLSELILAVAIGLPDAGAALQRGEGIALSLNGREPLGNSSDDSEDPTLASLGLRHGDRLYLVQSAKGRGHTSTILRAAHQANTRRLVQQRQAHQAQLEKLSAQLSAVRSERDALRRERDLQAVTILQIDNIMSNASSLKRRAALAPTSPNKMKKKQD